MAEKTYVADVAFESVKVNDTIVSEETPRLAALLGAGYLHEMSGPVYAVTRTEEDDSDLLERFEEADVVEVSTTPVKHGRRPRTVE